jgi:NADH-quinone oxidoreductase subunit J
LTEMQILFLITGGLTLLSAVMVVTVRKIMHAALWLVLALLGVAVVFILLEAVFFAVSQVVVYVGAIAILIIFTVMLTHDSMEDRGHQVNGKWLLPFILVMAIFIGILFLYTSWPASWALAPAGSGGEEITQLGKSFVDPHGYLVPFEVASILLITALLGAIYLGLGRQEGKR